MTHIPKNMDNDSGRPYKIYLAKGLNLLILLYLEHL